MAALTELLSLEERPTAVLTANDLTAIGGVRAAVTMGLSIPDDISIIGFDDIEMSDIIHPPLTTLRLPRFELAKAFFEALEHLRIHPHAQGEQRSIKTTLIVRESTGPIRRRRTR